MRKRETALYVVQWTPQGHLLRRNGEVKVWTKRTKAQAWMKSLGHAKGEFQIRTYRLDGDI